MVAPQTTIGWVRLGWQPRRCFHPQASHRRLQDVRGQEIGSKKACTFEYNGLLRDPNVAKSPCFLGCFNKNPSRQTQFISENVDLRRLLVLQIADWIDFEIHPVVLYRCREHIIEVRVLLEGQTFFALEMAEVPQNFFHVRGFTEHLWYTGQIP